MEDQINEQNLRVDEITYGRWSTRNDQFADEEPLKLAYDMFMEAKPELPRNLRVIEFGAADGMTGEYFKKRLKKDGFNPSLAILDVIQEHLEANPESETIKIRENLLSMNIQNEYDLGVVRSVFHYFSNDPQRKVATNIFSAIRPGGYFLSQNFVQVEADLGLYTDFNHMIGKNFQLKDEKDLLGLFEEVGFEEVTKLGDLPTWHYTSENLSKRYDLASDKIQSLRQKILSTPINSRIGFRITESGFTVPVPFKVFLMRKQARTKNVI